MGRGTKQGVQGGAPCDATLMGSKQGLWGGLHQSAGCLQGLLVNCHDIIQPTQRGAHPSLATSWSTGYSPNSRCAMRMTRHANQ